MSRRGIFWGILLIAIGILLLLSNLGIADINWESIWKLWPLLIIYWGIGVLFGDSKLGTGIGILTIILVFGAAIAGSSLGWFKDSQVPNTKEQTFYADKEVGTDKVNLEIDSGAGKITLDGSTDRAYEVNTVSSIGEYSYQSKMENGNYSTKVKLDSPSNRLYFGSIKNEVKLKLNPDLQWALDFTAGASSIELDLTNYKVPEIKVAAGASNIDLSLGDKQAESKINIDSGASTITINVPANIGCEAIFDGGLTSKNTSLNKIDEKTYRSSNFDSAEKKIFITINSGASSVTINQK